MEDKITLLYVCVLQQKLYTTLYCKFTEGCFTSVLLLTNIVPMIISQRCNIKKTMLSSTTWKVILVFVFPDIKNIVLFSGILICNKTKVIICYIL